MHVVAGNILRLFGDLIGTRMQDATRQGIPNVSASAQGNTITCELSTSFKNFPTRLGKRWTGYTVVSNPLGLVIESQPSPDDKKFVSLKGSAAGTVKISVF